MSVPLVRGTEPDRAAEGGSMSVPLVRGTEPDRAAEVGAKVAPMCGRYTLHTPASELQRELALAEAPEELVPRFNIAPTQQVAVVVNQGPRRLELARWGLVPFWAKDLRIGNKMINARCETVAEKPAFRRALRRTRCLIPADGFYEWRPGPLGKSPFYVRRRSGKPFAFAGLYDSWRGPDGSHLRSCAIVTTSANALVSAFHDRMPVILSPEDYQLWLAPGEVEPDRLQPLLAPYLREDLVAFEVSRLVDSPGNDLPECLLPA